MISFTQDHQEEKIEDLNKVINEGGEIVYDTTEIQKKSQENAINSYISTNWKLRRSEHISRNSLPRLNQEETKVDWLKRLITSSKIEFVILKTSHK